MNVQKSVLIVFGLGFLALGVAVSSDMMSSGQPDIATRVLSDLHQANRDEIVLGQMAKEKGASEQVRSFGDQVVKDHADVDKKVRELARKDGITLFLPATQGLLAHHQAVKEKKLIQELSNKRGTDFDQAFAQAMVDDHERDISKLQKAEKSLRRQTDVRDLVVELLPTLQQHLQRARQLQRNG